MGKQTVAINRPLVSWAINWLSGMLAGILVWDAWIDVQVGKNPWLWVWVCTGILSTILYVFRIAVKWRIQYVVSRFSILCLLLSLGATTMLLYLQEHQPFPIEKLNFSSHPFTIEAKVETSLKQTRSQNSLQSSIQIVGIKELKLSNCNNLHALLIVPKTFNDQAILPGQLIQIIGTVKKIEVKSIHDVLYPLRRLNEVQVMVLLENRQFSKKTSHETVIKILQSPLNPQKFVRDRIFSKLEAITPSQDVTFLAGLLFGVTDGMDPSLQQAYSVLGISHILAVSGMNIELLIRPCLWGLRKVRFGYRLSVCLTICIIVGYGLLTAGGASVIRAVITGVTMLAAGLFRRTADPLSALSLSCIVCLWVDPSNVANVGFQYSFLAALFLILFSSHLGRLLQRYRVPFHSGLAVFVSATAATLPIQLYVFQQWSPYSIVTNLLLEPIMPVCMISMLITILACFLCWPLAVLLGTLLHGIVWLLTKPILWLFHNGVPILQVQQNEAIWSFIIYGFVAACLIWNDGDGKSMHTILGSGKDRSTDFIR